MNGEEIYTLMTVKRAALEDLIDPATFVLNPEAQKLMNEITELQSECPHKFVDGECKYCGKEEE
jgi:hypothetical protein